MPPTHPFHSTPGNAYQLRALDFDTTGPFKDYPQVTVYHPSEGHAWAQVGFPGNVGVLTGFSDQHLAISEIGVSYPDDTFGQGERLFVLCAVCCVLVCAAVLAACWLHALWGDLVSPR